MTEAQFWLMMAFTFVFFFASSLTEVLLGFRKSAEKEEGEIVVRVSGKIVIAPEGVKVIHEPDLPAATDEGFEQQFERFVLAELSRLRTKVERRGQ